MKVRSAGGFDKRRRPTLKNLKEIWLGTRRCGVVGGVFRSFSNRRQFAAYAGLGADALAGRDPPCTNKASPKPETCCCEQNDPIA